MFIGCLLFILLLIPSESAASNSALDLKLNKIIEVYNLVPCERSESGPRSELGEKFFKSKELSGNRDISCETCHIDEQAFADGLPIAVGVGGEGESVIRLSHGGGALVQRNAFTLFERGNSQFRGFFWDGKVESLDDTTYSPFGDRASLGFNSPLSVAAILPLTERDEFLGPYSLIRDNDLQAAVGDTLYQDRYVALSKAIRERVWADVELARATAASGVTYDSFELADIGNAIADFIQSEFSCPESKWNDFLSGDSSALSEVEKKGAVSFFGAARCAGCHSPPLFSDFKYHGIGTPQGEFGPQSRARDLGRASVTNLSKDMYLFRTPPLIAVSKTAPYGHNGVFPTLESVVLHHVNPVAFFLKNPDYNKGGELLRLGRYIDSRSKKLRYIEISSVEKLAAITAFLETL
jgi:cytochrome c peroxidase